MMEQHDYALLGAVVRKCYGTENSEQRNGDGEFAEIVSIISESTFRLIDKDGNSYSWIQSLTRPAMTDETIAYWKARAKAAEEKLGK